MICIGDMRFKGIDFSFGFDGGNLKLVPCTGEVDKARRLTMRKLESAWAFPGDPIFFEEEFFVLCPRNSDLHLVVFPDCDQFIPTNYQKGAIHVSIGSYFEINQEAKITAMRFRSKHLGKCYDDREPVKTGVDFQAGTISAEAVPTVPRGFAFTFQGATISATLFHERKVTVKAGVPPVTINAVLQLEFRETDDYGFVRGLIEVARDALRYCLQTSDAEFDSIELRGPRSVYKAYPPFEEVGNSTGRIGIAQMSECHGEEITPAFHIPLGEFEKLDAGMFQLIADGDLSMGHLVEDEKRNIWDDARCILLAASFDYEVDKIYSKGIPHSRETLDARQLIVEYIDKAVEAAQTKKVRDKAQGIANRLKGIAEGGDSFSSRLYQLYKDHRDILTSIRPDLDGKDDFNRMSQRVEKLRNALAHGDLSVSADMTDLDDMIALEKIVLAIQMLRMGLSDKEAIEAIEAACER